jgi:hypothetical protein
VSALERAAARNERALRALEAQQLLDAEGSHSDSDSSAAKPSPIAPQLGEFHD